MMTKLRRWQHWSKITQLTSGKARTHTQDTAAMESMLVSKSATFTPRCPSVPPAPILPFLSSPSFHGSFFALQPTRAQSAIPNPLYFFDQQLRNTITADGFSFQCQTWFGVHEAEVSIQALWTGSRALNLTGVYRQSNCYWHLCPDYSSRGAVL